ncbi:unnamed protein product [Phytophthora lilii]|uniref:Unnamed protein product n=1 Tax=Phytophthora lilii TaxID=2077276 RepID=A0A9W6WYI6_9STRA|nr:unnamed protein product [Phytophthora lilii]
MVHVRQRQNARREEGARLRFLALQAAAAAGDESVGASCQSQVRQQMAHPARGSALSTSRSGRSSGRPDGDVSVNAASCVNLRHGGAAQGNTPGKLPLPDDFFSVPQLSAKENKYLLGLAKHACKEVVYYSRQEDGPMKWLHLSSEDGVDVFQGVDSSGTNVQQDFKALTYLRGSCKIRATIDEISDFFKLDTPEKLSGFTQTVGKDLLDQKTLLTLANPTPDNPKHYVAVKWTAVESPTKLARHRDFCYIGCHDEFIDTNTKRRGWVRSIHSIRLPFCPPLNRSHGLVRGSFYRSGFIFTESAEKGCVDAVHTLHVDIKGNAPNWMKILVMKRRIKHIAEVDRHFQLHRLARGKLLGDLELPAKDSVTRCQLCETRFGFFHRRRRCRKCGKVVCSPCGNEFLLDYAGVGPKKVRICVECSESVVYGISVPVMDAAGQIISDEHTGAKKILGSDIHPVYDDSPAGSMVLLENRQLSIEEHEYYMENEDEDGIAAMEEAKRMNKEFEELLKTASDKFAGQAALEESQRQADDNAKSLLAVNSPSGETQPVESPPGGDLPPWNERHQRGPREDDDDMEGDNELGFPPSKSEQIRKQLQYEDQRRRELIERAKKLRQHAAGTHSSEYFSTGSTEYGEARNDQPLRPRALGITRNESAHSLRLSSEWEDNYYGGIGRARPEVLTSFRSNGSGRSSSSGRGGVTRSALSGGRSRSGSQGAASLSSNGREYRYANGGIPRHRGDIAHRSRHDSNEEGRSIEDDLERQRRTQEYFEARNARLTLLSGRQRHTMAHDSVERLFEYERPVATRFRSSGIGAGSDPPARRQLSGSELESPYTSLSDSNLAGAFTTRRRHRSNDLEDKDEAFRLAMSAMRLYEEERGPNLKVSDETRQAALAKMMDVYAREIERSHSNDSGPYSRGTISDTRRLHYDVGIPPPLRRTVSDDRPPSIYGSPLQVFSHDDIAPASRRQRQAASSRYSRDVPAKRDMREETHEYKDLSDLTSSAFQAFQMNSLGPRDAPKLPVEAIESSEDSDSSKEEYQAGETHAEASPTNYQRKSTSTTHVNLKSDTSGDRSGAARATYGSIESSEVFNMVSRPNSMYGVADSDTFSDMDLIDLPHLMRKDDLENGARNSFADLQPWTEDSISQPVDEGVEYVPVPRLSDLLSPLHLEDVQHVENDDSESQSSNSSSQIDWQSSLAKKFPESGEQGRALRGGATDSESSFIRAYSIGRDNDADAYSDLTGSSAPNNGLSESMVTQNDDQPQRRYRKPPSLSDLLSEYCDSERSSLPSYLEFGQPELEPEYLQAIENSRLNGNNQSSIPVEGAKRGHVRRRSSIPSELEAMTSRELFL